MIPSSAKRTLIFLLLSVLVFWGPDWLVPTAWQHDATYPLVSNLYQGLLVIAGFWFGPALCNAMVVDEVRAGPLRQAIDRVLDELNTAGLNTQATAHSLAVLPVTLVDHPQPFIVTAGLLPGQCQVFLSTGQAVRLGPAGLRFLLTRAMVHGEVSQRMASMIPVLLLTVAFPDTLDWVTSLTLAGCCLGWLALHWTVELRVDAKAARVIGPHAIEGLRELIAATAAAASTLSLHAPTGWRLKACQGGGVT
ncbi:MAG: hypothetical protein ACYCY9_09235 [Thiobacillus sp.]